MTGEPVKLHFKEESKPHTTHTSIWVPHHWKQHIKDDLDKDACLCIIEKVPQWATSTWCAKMVVTLKNNGNPRDIFGLQQLKNATHYTLSPFDIVSTVPTKRRKITRHMEWLSQIDPSQNTKKTMIVPNV